MVWRLSAMRKPSNASLNVLVVEKLNKTCFNKTKTCTCKPSNKSMSDYSICLLETDKLFLRYQKRSRVKSKQSKQKNVVMGSAKVGT
jgi:hypothetical protein